jgi:serine/threonine protein kinase
LSLAPGHTLAQYRITAAIGKGGMGEVYRATDTKLGREVALKLLPEAFAADPERLARAVAFDGSSREPALGRPRALFVDVYDFGQGLSIPNYDVTRDGRFLMLRRAAQGGTLRVVLNWTEELKRTLAAGGVR